jgi:hypothetical protein
VAQLIVRNLDGDLKRKLRRRAAHNAPFSYGSVVICKPTG